MDKSKLKMTAYELRDGAYGMYLAVDGFGVDVDFGSYYYKKEDVDARVKDMEKRLKKVNEHLKNLRQKYSALCSTHSNVVQKCKELMNIIEEDVTK